MRSRGVVVFAITVIAAIGCGEDRIEIRQSENSDYNHGAMLTAVDKFVAGGRTPVAYGQLAQTAFNLRTGMDRSVARESELKLMVLALAPALAVRAKPIDDQIAVLATTVWPTLLAPEFEADELLFKRDPNAAAWFVKPGEDARAYLLRLCGGPLANDCKQVVPELQGPVVAAIATRRATERVRNAVSDCVMCGADQGWHEAVRAWEALDRMANSALTETERRADPDNWPVAGEAALGDPSLPEAEVNETGEVVIGGQRYITTQRISALHDLRGDSDAIALHLRPDLSLAQVRALLTDAHKSGAARVAVVARADRYPWDRKVYWLADGTGTSPGLRPTDSLQLLLHAVDKLASPGAVARVD
jgi:hypothetical protein